MTVWVGRVLVAPTRGCSDPTGDHFILTAAVFDCHRGRDVVDVEEMRTGDNFNV